MKMKKVSKMEKGGALGMKSVKAGFDKNPGVTRADVIVAAKKEAQLGSYKGVIGKNTKGKATKAVGLTKAKMGKSIGKCKSGC